MKTKLLNKRVLSVQIIVSLGILTLTLIPSGIPLGHASSTLVCLSTTTDSCPSSPAVFNAPVGNTLKVNVVIKNAAPFNGFQVWLYTSPSILNTTSLDLTGSILPSPSIRFECINGHGCEFWLGSGPGTDSLYASGNAFTGSNVTGLLFSVNYKVVGAGSGVPVGLYFQVSPSGWATDAAGISFTTGTALVPVQNATFNDCTGCGGNVFIRQTASFHDVTVTISGSLDLNLTARTLTGTVTLQAVNSTNGVLIFSKTFAINFHFQTATTVRFVTVIPSTPASLGTICSITTSTNQASCMVARNPDFLNHGYVDFVDIAVVMYRYGASQSSPKYNAAADLLATGLIDMNDVSIEFLNYGAPVFT